MLWLARMRRALGRLRGDFATRIHIRAEGQSLPVIFALSGGEVHDSKVLATLKGTGWIERWGGDAPASSPTGSRAGSSSFNPSTRLI